MIIYDFNVDFVIANDINAHYIVTRMRTWQFCALDQRGTCVLFRNFKFSLLRVPHGSIIFRRNVPKWLKMIL